ncbi:MAG: hypothetical protein HY547_09820 [Elusimicrobia bacterium]|nr:hypothetical protein [Elusimicrobiota bacterium]
MSLIKKLFLDSKNSQTPLDPIGDRLVYKIIILAALMVAALSAYTALCRFRQISSEKKSTSHQPRVNHSGLAANQKSYFDAAPAPSAEIQAPALESGAPGAKALSAEPQPPAAASNGPGVSPPAILDLKKLKETPNVRALLPRNILFTCVHYRAKKVALAGDFNNWIAQDMLKEKIGVWRLKVSIEPGTYRYNFLVDGNKVIDSYNKLQDNGSSILIVEPLSEKR